MFRKNKTMTGEIQLMLSPPLKAGMESLPN
jgi:hypothetical protein